MQRAAAGAAVLATKTMPTAVLASPVSGVALAEDEEYWANIAAQYDVTAAVIQLENGNWGMMSRPVLAAYQAAVAKVNRESSFYARRGMGADLESALDQLVEFLGVDRDEIVLTRNATEALKALIGGYNQIGVGQVALYADLDYDSMQASMVASMARRGARTIKLSLPEPATYQNVIDAYVEAFESYPDIKLVLLTHISHRTGLKIPVREISALARERGIDVIVDAAHSLGQVEFELGDLGADFIGINLHKWMGAPLGVGAAYIRKGRLSAIDPDIADEEPGSGLQALRNRWVGQVRDICDINVLTPDDPRMHGGITSFRLSGRTSEAENIALARILLDRFGIFTVHRTGLSSGACVRVTPALFNSMAELDALADALSMISSA
jgi:selenocysteine lyase/cysteine desulfurase